MTSEQELQKQVKEEDRVIRILAKDIEGKMNVYAGLTKIKGVSWSLSNAVCKVLKIDKNKKIGSLTDEEIKKISDFIKNPKVPEYIVNRRADFTTGQDKHLSGSDLELQKEFDIKRLKKIKSSLEVLGLGKLYEELGIYQELMRVHDTEVFIKNNYDEFNEVRDITEFLIHDSLHNEVIKKTFKFGIAIAQYLLKVARNANFEEINKIAKDVKWLMMELLEMNVFSKDKEKMIFSFTWGKNVPNSKAAVLKLKNQIVQWISKYET